jgi:BirA family biotin operon repressor/biotin-[acetyl-CoA-carboxylase] ligase
MAERFSRQLLIEALARHGDRTPRQIVVHEEIGSTSTDLAERLEQGAPIGTVVVAERQHAGRGRRGRSWHSPRTGSLYLSVAVGAPGGVDELLTMIPLAAGVAAVDALGDAGEPSGDLRLKWPNDLLLDGRKLAGILCEVPDPRRRPLVAVVGIGLNLGRTEFPAELEGAAVSLAEGRGAGAEREPLAAAWLAALDRWAEQIGSSGPAAIVAAWRERAEPFGRRVRVGELVGTTVDLNDHGHLIIQQDDGSRVEVSGGIVEPAEP